MLASCILNCFFLSHAIFLHCYLYLIFNFSTMCSLANFFQWCSPPDHSHNSTKKHVFFITFLRFSYLCVCNNTLRIHTYNIQTNINLHNIFLVEQLLSCGTTTTTTTWRLVICTQLNDLSKSSILCEAFYIHNMLYIYEQNVILRLRERTEFLLLFMYVAATTTNTHLYLRAHKMLCVCVRVTRGCISLVFNFVFYTFSIAFLFVYIYYTAILFVFFQWKYSL